MVSSSLFWIVVGVLCALDTVTSTNEYIFEFGKHGVAISAAYD